MDPKAIWTDYLTSVEEAERRHAVTCGRCMSGYNRFYDLASRISESVAAEALPKEAAAAREVEESAAKLADLRKEALPVLIRAMSAKMAEIACSSGGHEGDASGLRNALVSLDRFRIDELDGRDGRMRELVLQGQGARKSERDRLLNIMVAIWCKANGRGPQEAVAMLEPFGRLLPDPAGGSDNPGMFLSMAVSRGLDIAAALEDAMEWEDLDQVTVEQARQLVGVGSRAGLNGARGL